MVQVETRRSRPSGPGRAELSIHGAKTEERHILAAIDQQPSDLKRGQRAEAVSQKTIWSRGLDSAYLLFVTSGHLGNRAEEKLRVVERRRADSVYRNVRRQQGRYFQEMKDVTGGWMKDEKLYLC